MHLRNQEDAHVPAYTKDWFRAGPFGDSLDDLAAFDKISTEMEESCLKGSFYLVIDEMKCCWILTDPSNSFSMKVIGKMMKAYNDNALLDEADLADTTEQLCHKYWEKMTLAERMEMLSECSLPVSLAVETFYPEAVAESILDLVEENHPIYGC